MGMTAMLAFDRASAKPDPRQVFSCRTESAIAQAACSGSAREP
jgi:hypothetical protein